MAHYRIFNINNSQAEEGLFLNKQEAESELRTIKRHSQDKFKVVTVEEAHKLHWKEERKLRKLLT